MLIDAGYSESEIIERMGWEDSRMLHRVYRRKLEGRDQRKIEALNALERGESAAG